jgi:hypothetical protein
MKSSEILRKAARRVERGMNDGGCGAIAEVSGALRFKAREIMDFERASGIFARYLRQPNCVYWWPREPAHGPRIIGLCLAAAIAESEGD